MKRALKILSITLMALLLTGVAGTWYVTHRTAGEFFESNGQQTYYTDEGEGVPVILVHGFAVNADLNWRKPGIVKALAKDYRVITLDCRGHGLSAKPHERDHYGKEMIDDVARLMDHLEIEKAHLVGYSMGGFITLKFAETYPERLYSAIPCASGWDTLDGESGELMRDIVASIEDHGRFDPISNRLDPTHHANAFKLAAANFFIRSANDVEAVVNVFRAFGDFEVAEDYLRKNEVPCRMIVGTKDGIRDMSEKLDGVMTNHETYYVEGGDHITTILKPSFLRGIQEFLAAHNPAEETPAVAKVS